MLDFIPHRRRPRGDRQDAARNADTMAAMQANMHTMMPKIQEVQQDIIARLAGAR